MDFTRGYEVFDTYDDYVAYVKENGEPVYREAISSEQRTCSLKALQQQDDYFGVLDIDELIEKRSGMPIAELCKKEGEDRFRQLESDIIRSISSIRNHVVITGAGALEFGENLKMLQEILA